jgi:rhomboid-like protein
MLQFRLQGIRLKVSSRLQTISNALRQEARFYVRGKGNPIPKSSPGKSNTGKSIARRPDASAERDVWVDPFKAPPPPKPDLKVLRKPFIFTVGVCLVSNYVADYVVDNRTSIPETKAQRDSETRWTVYPIVGLNVAIFGLWRVFPSLLYRIGAIMVPYAVTPSQLIVNTMSHQEVWHLVLNQIAFISFGSTVCDLIGREHFLSFYLSSACVSSLGSAAATQILVKRGFYDYSALHRGSLGASGVVYAMLGVSALTYPDLGIGLLFLPIFFPIKYVFPALCSVDAAGVALRWSRFDHVAHVTHTYESSLIDYSFRVRLLVRLMHME